MQAIALRTAGEVRMGPGTLYGLIKRMLADGWIEELDERPDPALDDERRRYYRLTDLGQRVASAEAERLAAPGGGRPPAGAAAHQRPRQPVVAAMKNDLASPASHAQALILSDRVYRGLLAAYPLEFRRRYGPEMAQVFRTCCHASYRLSGARGVLRLWLPTLWDWAWTATRERFSSLFRRSMMNDTAAFDRQAGRSGLVISDRAASGIQPTAGDQGHIHRSPRANRLAPSSACTPISPPASRWSRGWRTC